MNSSGKNLRYDSVSQPESSRGATRTLNFASGLVEIFEPGQIEGCPKLNGSAYRLSSNGFFFLFQPFDVLSFSSCPSFNLSFAIVEACDLFLTRQRALYFLQHSFISRL